MHSPPIHRSIDSASTPLPPRQPDLVGIGCSINAVGESIQITSITPNGGCAQCGQIRVGDFIASIDGQKVTTVAACVPLIKGLPNTPVRLYIRRPTPSSNAFFDVVVTRIAAQQQQQQQPSATATPHATQPVQHSRQFSTPADGPSAARASPEHPPYHPASNSRNTLPPVVERPEGSISARLHEPSTTLPSLPQDQAFNKQQQQQQQQQSHTTPAPPAAQPAPANVGIGVSISLAPSGAVQILSINPAGGAAATGQVSVGDIISKINGLVLRTIEEARSLIPGPPGSECSLLLKRVSSATGRSESHAVIVRRISTSVAGGPAIGPSQAVTPQSSSAPSRDRSLYSTGHSVPGSAAKSAQESPAQTQPPSRGDPPPTFGTAASIGRSLDSASTSIGRSIDGGRVLENRMVDTGSPRGGGAGRGGKVANSPLSAFSTFSGDTSKATGDGKVSADKLAQDLRMITLDLKMKMENDREAQVMMCSTATMTELRGSDVKKKDDMIESLKQRIEEVSRSSDDLRRQSSQMSSRYTDALQQVKALEAETLILKQQVFDYQSQCEELAHGQRHALSKLTELDAENRILKEQPEIDSGRSSHRGSRLGLGQDDSADRKFHNDLHATLMASLVHISTRPQADHLGNHPEAIDPQKLISKALAMLQARMASSSGADPFSEVLHESSGGGAASARVLSPPRGPNMHLQTRFTGMPASPSFGRQGLQTPASVISKNSGFV